MRVLRANRDSLMAVLEAFVFDPLVSWLYIQDPDSSDDTGTATNRRRPASSAAGRASGAHYDVAGISLGSRPDEPRGSFSHYPGADDNGWQTGNPKARAIVKRIYDKLVGTDFDPNKQLDVAAQIDSLIQQATSSENLAVMWR
ncbi:phosphatidylinositol kinase- protein kinase tor1, partial [Coemansia sp. RSA 2530]